MNHTNTINSNFVFSVKKEVNLSLPFPDSLIKEHFNGTLNFEVYRKRTTSYRHQDYVSNDPSSHKRDNVIVL